ncbi:twin-arginine translocase TatA/TatE family subunit [Cellulomonas gilvus]|uniref:Twin-arginine translocation protein, TatB subunit n=1 Tax=Cellulomonas gilvus (strain ATCC 13127 / NRRL B-14078) TaxID=593907 RepID=F8A2N7_CELGA|nr:twin-arginine translocase TatA/TatE family subunit [Cellulomonas gilvus]AEI13030.1 twin-arginine translocation protein, TatB subunit [Cellulomonas gilvus ATCC 13127]
MFDINGGEFLVILVIAALVIGPQRLPEYAEQLGSLVKRGRAWIAQARTRIDDETGDLGVDWEALDPRRYDPRRIVRDALLEPETAPSAPRPAGAAVVPVAARAGAVALSGPAPFDDEAT